jgi:hypothetical protein
MTHIAYKTHKFISIEHRTPGVLEDYPSEKIEILLEEQDYYVNNGYIVLTVSDYNNYVSNLELPNILSINKAKIELYIKNLQDKSQSLLTSLYSQNTLNGMTTTQSNLMFDEYEDVVLRLKEGAWPSALQRLREKMPSETVSQQMIDTWITTIESAMQ